MFIYLILMAVFGLLILSSVGIMIFGLFKKQKKTMITAAVLIVVGITGCVYFGLTYSNYISNPTVH